MKKLFLAFVAIVSIGLAGAFANYTMTQGAGTTFGSVVVGGFHYVQMFVCDLTTPAQCQSVSAGGAAKVDGTGGTFPVTGTVTANAGTNLNTSALATQTTVASIDTKTPSLGQALAAASVPVILPSATVTTLTPPSNTGYSTSANQTNGTQQSKITDGASIAAVKTANTVATTDIGLVVAVANTLAPGQAAMSASSPVVISSNQSANALWGQGATSSAVPANAIYNGVLDAAGGTNMLGLAGDPCQTSVKTTVPITLATAAVKVIVTGVSAKKIYVCQLYLNNNAADTVAVFEATTATTCATSAVAVIGAGTSVATAGTGNNWGATGGVSLGNGASQVLQTATNANDLCIAQSAATQLSGSITYVTR